LLPSSEFNPPINALHWRNDFLSSVIFVACFLPVSESIDLKEKFFLLAVFELAVCEQLFVV
jgi:hypothetical protein